MSEAPAAVGLLRAEWIALSREEVSAVADAALGRVVEWRWAPAGLRPPQVTPYAAEREAGRAFRWLERAPRNAADGDQHGFGDDGRLYVSCDGVGLRTVYEHWTGGLRGIRVASDGSAPAIECVEAPGGRVLSSVSVGGDEHGSSWNQEIYNYDGSGRLAVVTRQFRYSTLLAGEAEQVIEGHCTEALVFDAGGRLVEVRSRLNDGDEQTTYRARRRPAARGQSPQP